MRKAASWTSFCADLGHTLLRNFTMEIVRFLEHNAFVELRQPTGELLPCFVGIGQGTAATAGETESSYCLGGEQVDEVASWKDDEASPRVHAFLGRGNKHAGAFWDHHYGQQRGHSF